MLWKPAHDFPFSKAWGIWTLLRLRRSLAAPHLSHQLPYCGICLLHSLSSILYISAFLFSLRPHPWFSASGEISLLYHPASSLGNGDALPSVKTPMASSAVSLISPSSLLVFHSWTPTWAPHMDFSLLSWHAVRLRAQASLGEFLSAFLLGPHLQRGAALNLRESLHGREHRSQHSSLAPSLWCITPESLGQFIGKSWEVGTDLVCGWTPHNSNLSCSLHVVFKTCFKIWQISL